VNGTQLFCDPIHNPTVLLRSIVGPSNKECCCAVLARVDVDVVLVWTVLPRSLFICGDNEKSKVHGSMSNRNSSIGCNVNVELAVAACLIASECENEGDGHDHGGVNVNHVNRYHDDGAHVDPMVRLLDEAAWTCWTYVCHSL
jgi:hypothetical protein